MTIEVTNYISLMENDIRLNLCDKYAAIVLDNIAKSTDELINETGNSIYKLTTQSPDNTKRMAFIKLYANITQILSGYPVDDKTAIFSIMITKYAIYVKKPEYPFNIPKIEFGNGYYAVIFRCENGSKLIQVFIMKNNIVVGGGQFNNREISWTNKILFRNNSLMLIV